jgi:hypothetical protein
MIASVLLPAARFSYDIMHIISRKLWWLFWEKGKDG